VVLEGNVTILSFNFFGGVRQDKNGAFTWSRDPKDSSRQDQDHGLWYAKVPFKRFTLKIQTYKVPTQFLEKRLSTFEYQVRLK